MNLEEKLGKLYIGIDIHMYYERIFFKVLANTWSFINYFRIQRNIYFISVDKTAPPAKRSRFKEFLFKRIHILQWLPNYTRNDVISDFIAGITVGLTMIPQSLAYAGLAGVSPEYGLYTAFIGSFTYIFFGTIKEVISFFSLIFLNKNIVTHFFIIWNWLSKKCSIPVKYVNNWMQLSESSYFISFLKTLRMWFSDFNALQCFGALKKVWETKIVEI